LETWVGREERERGREMMCWEGYGREYTVGVQMVGLRRWIRWGGREGRGKRREGVREGGTDSLRGIGHDGKESEAFNAKKCRDCKVRGREGGKEGVPRQVMRKV